MTWTNLDWNSSKVGAVAIFIVNLFQSRLGPGDGGRGVVAGEGTKIFCSNFCSRLAYRVETIECQFAHGISGSPIFSVYSDKSICGV